jgi:hypothetical protein
LEGFRSILAACLCAASCTVGAAELVTNGGFETGDLSNWTVSGAPTIGGCQINWLIGNTGDVATCIGNAGNPVDGTYAVYNSFDGGGPLSYQLRQTVVLPAGAMSAATLSWQDTFFYTPYGPAERLLKVNILNADGSSVIANAYTYAAPVGGADPGWLTRTVDLKSILAPLAGQTITLEFEVVIPESFTGPAGMGLDSVSLDVTAAAPSPVAVPTLTEWGLIGLAFVMGLAATVRRRRNIWR